MSRLWEKGGATDEEMLGYTVGEDYLLDARLVAYDVRASIAHAQMLMERGHLTARDFEQIRAGLEALVVEHAAGRWQIAQPEEDVHTALEMRLIARIGEAGGRVHLGRSRNDQVLAALRLYLKDVIAAVAESARGVVAALGGLAEAQGEVPLPGYTHMQRAMPSTVRLWADGFAAEIADDIAALERSRARIDRNPLGSAAGYGTPGLEIDRERTRALLGFAEVHEPVTAVQLSRGKGEAAIAFELTLLMQDFGRLAAEVCLFATSEYAFVVIAPELTTGSSIMPQKRNPDVFELVRGRAALLAGELAQILALAAKLPSGYHRDLQLIKAPLFRAIDSTLATAGVLAHALAGVRFRAERTAQALDPSLYAAEKANRLVREEGIPFREAYRRVAAELDRSP